MPACRWAIFQNQGELPMSLIDAEMYCHMKWLPESEYAHALAPEIEVYPIRDSSRVEYWLPVIERETLILCGCSENMFSYSRTFPD